MSFGDINLSEEPIRGDPHNPGAGGWPTIRYFNKATGIEGGTYEKKTDKSMCDELGDEDYMVAYVEEYGNTSLCSIAEGYPGCDEREKGYIDKMRAKDIDECISQLKRLVSMDDDGGAMKAHLKVWLKKRKKILEQLVTAPAAVDSGEL